MGSEVNETAMDELYRVKEGLVTIEAAHEQRLKAEAEAREKTAAEQRAAEYAAWDKELKEKRRKEHEATLSARREAFKKLLAANPTRWACSIGGVLVKPKRGTVVFPCPHCGHNLPGVADELATTMGRAFENLWCEDDSKRFWSDWSERFFMPRMGLWTGGQYSCPGCGRLVNYRVMAIPW